MQIRVVAPEELPAWLAAMRSQFLIAEPPAADEPGLAAAFAATVADPARPLGAFAGDRVVATFRSFTTPLTVPGGEVVADAVTNVTVAPTHRRRGLLSTLMRDDLAAAAGRGESVAILIASEWPIYGRYGFGAATDIATWEVDTRGL